MTESGLCSMDMHDDLEGEDFLITFKLQPDKVLNKGMCGEIVLVTPLTKPEIKCVVKKFSLLDEARKKKNRRHFQTELKIMQSFDHPFLMYCVIAGQCPEYMAICMCYYQKGTLKDYVTGMNNKLSELCITQVACALRYLHKHHVVHMDVKLENIFMDSDFNAILGDFGLAVEMTADKKTLMKGNCGGTSTYFPPERRGAPPCKELDPYKLDSYCLGVVLWALVFEKEPSAGSKYYKETRKKRDLPPRIRRLLLKLLETNPSRRVTVTDFLIKLRRKSQHRHVIDRW